MPRTHWLAMLSAIAVMAMLFSSADAQYRPAEDEPIAETGRSYSYDNMPPRQLIDCPTAATLPRASFAVNLRTSSNGSVILNTTIGLHRRLMLGVSYGGEGILGDGKADGYDQVEFNVKYQLISETLMTPAIAFGYDGQGSGRYFNDMKRFMYKSKGFYAVVSKGYQTYRWSSGLHGGVNYSLESDVDGEEDVTVFFGADLSVQQDVSLVAEYDLALNDNKDEEHSGKGWGYLNLGIRWIFSERLEIGFDIQNVIDNRNDTTSPTRGLKITYHEFF